MKKRISSIALAPLAFATFASLGIAAQTAPTHTPPRAVGPRSATHRAAAAGEPLPKNIPAAPGVPKSLYALRYVDTKPGTGEAAMPGWVYTVHYTGWLYDGTKFDSSVDRGTPFDFLQGRRSVIPGWDTGFDGMKVGGKRRLFIPYQLAYGERGQHTIPPKANLIFDIELISQRDPNAPVPVAPAPAAAPTPSPAPPAGKPTAPPAGETTPESHSTAPPTPKPE